MLEQFKLHNLEKNMRKLCTDEVGGVKLGKNDKKRILRFEKTYFLYCSYLAALLALYFKDDLVSLRRFSCNILNDSKWRRIKKDLPECWVIS